MTDEEINYDEVVEHSGYTLVGAGLGALIAGPVGLAVGGVLGFLIGAAKQQMNKEGEENEPKGNNEQGTDGNGQGDE